MSGVNNIVLFFNIHPILMQFFSKCSSFWVIDGP